MGEMIMIWLLAENTSNQSEKTMRYGEASWFFNSSILASYCSWQVTEKGGSA
jgi:hypothetical protein